MDNSYGFRLNTRISGRGRESKLDVGNSVSLNTIIGKFKNLAGTFHFLCIDVVHSRLISFQFGTAGLLSLLRSCPFWGLRI